MKTLPGPLGLVILAALQSLLEKFLRLCAYYVLHGFLGKIPLSIDVNGVSRGS